MLEEPILVTAPYTLSDGSTVRGTAVVSHKKHVSLCVLNETGQVVHRIKVRAVDQMTRILDGLPDSFEVCYGASCGHGFLRTSLRNRGPYTSPTVDDVITMQGMFKKYYPEFLENLIN